MNPYSSHYLGDEETPQKRFLGDASGGALHSQAAFEQEGDGCWAVENGLHLVMIEDYPLVN